jgi:hypothetical protein
MVTIVPSPLVMTFHWTCPFCDRDTTITNTHLMFEYKLQMENSVGYRRFVGSIIVCPNPKCKKFSLVLVMFKHPHTQHSGGQIAFGESNEALQSWNLIPPSNAKVFPDYVPQPIRDDYGEACAIRDLSPKASATLSRRCLQGMIRDFWKVSKPRLIEEIQGIEDKVDADTWAAIDAVRSVGNIGAHMEKDINVIVDVDPQEAQLLIELIELLIKDWYITRHERAERLKAIVKVKDAKDAAKSASPQAKP